MPVAFVYERTIERETIIPLVTCTPADPFEIDGGRGRAVQGTADKGREVLAVDFSGGHDASAICTVGNRSQM